MLRRARAFTLIELLIVVVIISFLAAVMIPAMLRQLDHGRQSAPVAGRQLSQAAPSASAASADGAAGAAHIESTDVSVDLRASQVLDDGAVHTDYEAAFRGTFVIRNTSPASAELSFSFPFPPALREARDVSLRLRERDGTLTEPPAESVSYRRTGVRWSGAVPAGQSATVVVAYLARGRDAFQYDAAGGEPGNARSGQVRFALHYTGVRPVVPPGSLQPAEAAPGYLVWRFSGIITDQPILVELPAGSTPLGRLILLCQLAGLAVLLFGVGFWYLSEGQLPGGLDHFRLGHFLLLALTYSLFFVVFAVVGYGGHTALALLCGALTGVPLLLLHTSRTSGWPFALRRATPLAVFSLGCVVLGVYLEDQRAYVLAGAVVTMVAYATLSYRGWAAGRLTHRLDALERTCQRAEATERAAAAFLLEHATLPGSQELERDTACLLRRLSRVRTLLAEPQDLVRGQHLALYERTGLRLDTESVAERLATLSRTLSRVRDRAEQERQGSEEGARCLVCGTAADPRTPYCPACGTQRPLRLSCTACGVATHLPVHLFRRRWQQPPLHCAACGGRLPVPTAAPAAEAGLPTR